MEIPAPVASPPIETAARGRKASDEPNPSLDEGWLWTQYEAVNALIEAGQSPESATQSVTVAGGWEEVQATNRQRELLIDAETGDPVMIRKLTGDAATVEKLLRKAAAFQEIGVAIRAIPALTARGKVIPGMVEVRYLAKERKQKKAAVAA